MSDTSKPEALRDRTKQFSYRILRLFRALPRNAEGYIVGRQLLRAGTSVAANYRAVCRARSKAEFIAKIGVVLEEADESEFWLEFIADSGIMKPSRVAALLKEVAELKAIFAASQQTARQNNEPMTQRPDDSIPKTKRKAAGQ
jgi:four helix bundle protein